MGDVPGIVILLITTLRLYRRLHVGIVQQECKDGFALLSVPEQPPR